MSNNPKRSKTNITKISAKPSAAQSPAKAPENPIEAQPASETPAQQPVETQKSTETQTPAKKPKNRKDKSSKPHKDRDHEKPLKEVFILARPFVAIGRYLRDSWREIRQVRWPNRKLTWKMTFAVLAYCAIFIVFITLLDTLFTFIFNLLLNAK